MFKLRKKKKLPTETDSDKVIARDNLDCHTIDEDEDMIIDMFLNEDNSPFVRDLDLTLRIAERIVKQEQQQENLQRLTAVKQMHVELKRNDEEER